LEKEMKTEQNGTGIPLSSLLEPLLAANYSDFETSRKELQEVGAKYVGEPQVARYL
jgi:hypothetical protein